MAVSCPERCVDLAALGVIGMVLELFAISDHQSGVRPGYGALCSEETRSASADSLSKPEAASWWARRDSTSSSPGASIPSMESLSSTFFLYSFRRSDDGAAGFMTTASRSNFLPVADAGDSGGVRGAAGAAAGG